MVVSHKRKLPSKHEKFLATCCDFEGLLIPRPANFEDFFPHIERYVEQYTWYTEGDFWLPSTQLDTRLVTDEPSRVLQVDDWCIADTVTLSWYADRARNNWNSLFGFANVHDYHLMSRELSQTRTYGELSEFIKNEVDVGMCNVDGAYWAIFSSHAEILSSLSEACADTNAVQLGDAIFGF